MQNNNIAFNNIFFSRPSGRSQIVNGEDAKQGQFPYQLSWQYPLSDGTWFHFCGGSIYDATTMITAAHCCDIHTNTRVVAGDQLLSDKSGIEQSSGVVSEKRHEGYLRLTKENDICIVKLDTEFELNENAAPVAMPLAEQIFEGKAIVSGWGRLEYGGASPDALQFVELDLITDERKSCI